MSDMKIAVLGAGGRMGQALARVLAETPGCALAGGIEAKGSPYVGRDIGEAAGLDPVGIAITDDPLPVFAAVDGVLDFTTPSSTLEFVALSAQARLVHVIGTTGLSAADEARGVLLKDRAVWTRDGDTGPRRDGDIGFAALRGGDVVGEHRVIFAGPGERIELAHIATDRGIFARGAVTAALWARGREPGLYSMQDVLGLGQVRHEA